MPRGSSGVPAVAEPATAELPPVAATPTDSATTELPRVAPPLAPVVGPGAVRADGDAADPGAPDGAPAEPGHEGGDTGPIPLVGTRPSPPPPVPPVVGAGTPPPRAGGIEPGYAAGTRETAAAESPAPSPGRAGRNLGAAIGVGLGLGAAIVLTLVLWRPSFLAVLTAAVLVGIVELSRALRDGGFRPPVVPVVVGALGMIALAWSRGPTGLTIAFLLTVLAVLLWRLAEGPEDYARDSAAGVLVALYVPLLAGFAVLLLVPPDGMARILVFIATVVCNDVGGYAAGVLFGKHPMAPSISPKKSWEGLAGSIVACALVATLIMVFTFHRPWWGGLALGAALAASATVGDLAESLIKRDLGIKDMGHLLPGHGGIMDRLDSLLPSAVVAYLLLSALAPA